MGEYRAAKIKEPAAKEFWNNLSGKHVIQPAASEKPASFSDASV
jgi:hypothetical protein